MNKCIQVETVNRYNDKTILLEKNLIRTNTKIVDLEKEITFLKTIALANLGFLITLLITALGGMGFILWELRNLPL